MANLQLYHGTSSPISGSFRPLSHFGTIESACAVAYAKTLGQGGKLYEVTISCADHEIYVASEDWGSSRAIALLAHLMDSTGSQILSTAHQEAINKKVNVGRDASEAHALGAVLNFCSNENWKLIAYPNSLEGPSGVTSYCLIDQNIISNLTLRSLNATDILLGYRNLENNRLRDINSARAGCKPPLPPLPLHPE